jgi:hypothetical protein
MVAQRTWGASFGCILEFPLLLYACAIFACLLLTGPRAHIVQATVLVVSRHLCSLPSRLTAGRYTDTQYAGCWWLRPIILATH